MSLLTGLSSQLFGLFYDILNTTLHVEGSLGEVIVLASQDLTEALDSLWERYELASVASEHLSHLEGLGEELLDLTGTGNSELVLF